jgi:hypothetical protein
MLSDIICRLKFVIQFQPSRNSQAISFAGRQYARALGSSALEILIALLERRGELVRERELVALVGPISLSSHQYFCAASAPCDGQYGTG